MAYSFFPGCSLDASAKSYRTSIDWTLDALGIEVTELSDWNCCGATSTHALHTPYVDAVPARNLALAEAEDRDILVACSACYHRLQRTHQALVEDPVLRERMESIIGQPLTPKRQVYNLLEILASDEILKQVQQRRTDSWKGVRVGCYYGCLAVRIPGAEGFDDTENPMSMDRIVEAAGAEAIDWPHKTRCCGASLSVTGPEYAERLCDQILEMAQRCHLDLLVTGCPFCQYNLDVVQWQRDSSQEDKSIPIVFITQFLGTALGASFKEMKFASNLAGVEALKRRMET